MKTRTVLILILTASVGFLYSGCATSRSEVKETVSESDSLFASENTQDPMSLETFQDSLSGYGQFIKIDSSEVDPDNELFDDGTEMTNMNAENNSVNNSNENEDVYTNIIWVPNSNNLYEGWNPYNDGRWEWTGYGWLWVSDYSWGWGPYHYGRWWYSNVYGWVWSPGRIWGPSWVNWCNNGEYVGWYPSSPRNHWRNHRVIRVNRHYRHDGWVVVRKKDMTDPISSTNIIGGKVKDDVINGAKPKLKGPDVKEIEKIKGVKIETKNVTEKGNNNTKKENNNVTKNDDNKKIVDDVKNANVLKEGNSNTNDQNKKNPNDGSKTNNDSKSKTDVNGVTNYNTSKTYNSTETYNKTNTGSKENTNKTDVKKEDKQNTNTKSTNTEPKKNTGSTYNPESSNKTSTTNRTGTTSPKISEPPKVKQPPPPVKQSPPPVKQEPKQSPPPVKQQSPPEKKNN